MSPLLSKIDSGLYSVSLGYLSIHILYQYHNVFMYIYDVLISVTVSPLALFYFLKIVLPIVGSLNFHTNFEINFHQKKNLDFFLEMD